MYPLFIMHIFRDFSIDYCDDSDNESKKIQESAIEAIISYGNLGIPQLEHYIKSIELDSRKVPNLLRILSGINTLTSAKLMIKLYALEDKDTHVRISFMLAQMMTNKFLESDLRSIEPADLPENIQKIIPDGNGWPHEKEDTGASFLSLDMKIREDILFAILAYDSDDTPNSYFTSQLSNLSFKWVFPAFLAYLVRLNKKEEISSEIVEKIGYHSSEDNEDKISFLANKIKGDKTLSLDYALKGIGVENTDPFNETKGQKIIKVIANVYFVLFLLLSLFFNGYGPYANYLNNDLSNINRYFDIQFFLNYKFKYAVFFGLLFLLYYSILVIYNHKKYNRKTLSISIIATIFCPFTNYLKLLPHILKMNVWLSWIILFCLPNVFLSCFFGGFLDDPSNYIPNIQVFYLITCMYYIPQTLLIILSFLYLKHIVLKTNPIYHLIHLHPQGQKVLKEG